MRRVRPASLTCVGLYFAVLASLLQASPVAAAEVPPGGCGHPALEAIEQARQNGELSEEEAILYRFYLAVDRSRLPDRFREGPPLRCGTAFVNEAYSRLPELSPAVREAIASCRRARPLPEIRETPHFLIHYATTGPDAVPDLAYVDSVAAACEHGWSALHLSRPWNHPPGDGEYGGGVDKIDCTIRDEEGLGHAAIIDSVPGGAPYDYTAEFFVDHAISPDCLVQTTVVHEYMHVVQVGYGFVNAAGWYLENSAMMAQEWAYDECDDYHDWLNCFFNYPYRRLITRNGCYEYGAIVWPMYQSERFDEEVVERIWALLRWNGNIYASHEQALGEYGYSMGGAYLELMRWCFYTRHRADSRHFEEARGWPTRLFAQRSHDAYPTGEQHPLYPPEGLGTAALLFRPEPGSSDQVIDFTLNGPDCALGVQFFVKWEGEQSYFEYAMSLDSHGDGVLSLPGFDAADSVFMLVSMNSTCSGARDFTYSAVTRADPAAAAPGRPREASTEFLAAAPNPSSGPIALTFDLPRAGRIAIEILDPGGRRVRELCRSVRRSGAGEVVWDGRGDNGRPLRSGLYLARLRFEGRERVRKIILLRTGEN
jgi:hypothetical protein